MAVGSTSIGRAIPGAEKHRFWFGRVSDWVSGELAPGEGALPTWTLAVVVILAGAAITDTSLTQVVILVAAVPLAIAAAIRSPRTLVLVLAPWLVALGLLRRVLLGLGSGALLGDPLLLIEPAVLALLAVVALRRGAARNRTVLAKGVVALSLLALIEVINPLQGGLTVGLGGLLFVLVPMLAFWVGRSLCDDVTMRRLLILVGLLAIPAAIYGLIQTYVGFPSWDTRWIQTVTANGTYGALEVNGVTRAFSSFSSAEEYGSFLSVGIAVWFALGRRPGRLPGILAALALLGTAVFLESARGTVVLTILAAGVMMAAFARVRLMSAALWGLAAVVVLYLGISHISAQQNPAVTTPSQTQALVQHEVEGLSQPFNPQTSTLGAHFRELVSGLKAAFTDPVGHGTGAINLSAARFGGLAQGTEGDPSNAGVAFGLPGLVAYLVVLISGLAAAYRVAVQRRDWLAIATLGVLVVTIFQWLNGGLYAVAWLPWLILGWVDRTKHCDLSANGLVPTQSTHLTVIDETFR